ncbi:MAG: DUF1697 domain-containing protein [Acidobacteriota bacterium]
MPTYIALLRGINVLGRNSLPMKELRLLFEAEGCRDVRTYIQSGNVIFDSPAATARRLPLRVAAAVARTRAFEPRVLIITRAELDRAAAGNPFPEADTNPRSLHVFFLARKPTSPDVAAMETLRTPTERFALDGKAFYLYTPDGFGPSRLADRVERLLGVDATARNWRTVTTLLEMASS